jgi:hypothetical protein
MRKELSTGPNKILLLPEDLEFTGVKSSDVLSKASFCFFPHFFLKIILNKVQQLFQLDEC